MNNKIKKSLKAKIDFADLFLIFEADLPEPLSLSESREERLKKSKNLKMFVFLLGLFLSVAGKSFTAKAENEPVAVTPTELVKAENEPVVITPTELVRNDLYIGADLRNFCDLSFMSHDSKDDCLKALAGKRVFAPHLNFCRQIAWQYETYRLMCQAAMADKIFRGSDLQEAYVQKDVPQTLNNLRRADYLPIPKNKDGDIIIFNCTNKSLQFVLKLAGQNDQWLPQTLPSERYIISNAESAQLAIKTDGYRQEYDLISGNTYSLKLVNGLFVPVRDGGNIICQ